MSFLKWLKEFDSGERKTIALLLFLILIIITILNINTIWKKEVEVEKSYVELLNKTEKELNQQNDQIHTNKEKNKEDPSSTDSQANEKRPAKVVAFNPDTLSVEEWKHLGFSHKQSQALVNYREALGGSFNEETFLASFVIDSIKYKELQPYIQFNKNPQKTIFEEDDLNEIPEELVVIDIQKADTTRLKYLKGIGPVLSKRIVAYRNQLGGFNNINQIVEVYGIESAWLEKNRELIKVGDMPCKKIAINSSGFEELKAHPYIDYSLAKSIVNYKKYRGNFTTIDDLMKIPDIKEAKVIKLEPYLKFDND